MPHAPHPDDPAALEVAFEDGRLSGVDGTARDCPFDFRAVLVRAAWHAGFSHGRMQARRLPAPPQWPPL
jgi:ribosome modulation factor